MAIDADSRQSVRMALNSKREGEHSDLCSPCCQEGTTSDKTDTIPKHKTNTEGTHRHMTSDRAIIQSYPELAGRSHAGLRKVLQALDDLEDELDVTLYRVADVASLTPRWTRHCLKRLEALGLIEWVKA